MLQAGGLSASATQVRPLPVVAVAVVTTTGVTPSADCPALHGAGPVVEVSIADVQRGVAFAVSAVA